MEPYKILGVDPGASDETIRSAYLRLVREHPPDRDPKRFAEIQAAYDRVRDPSARLDTLLTEPDPGPGIDELIRETAQELLDRRLPTDVVLSMADGP